MISNVMSVPIVGPVPAATVKLSAGFTPQPYGTTFWACSEEVTTELADRIAMLRRHSKITSQFGSADQFMILGRSV